MMPRFRILALVAVVALWAVGQAGEPFRRSGAGTVHQPIVTDEPPVGEDDQDAEPPDDDQLDGGRALPSEPALRPPPGRRVPPGEDEEPAPPADTLPVRSGPAEPASAAQPLPPG